MKRLAIIVIACLLQPAPRGYATELGNSIAGRNLFYAPGYSDNVWSVAERFKINGLRILAANPSASEDLGNVSQTLIIPLAHIVPRPRLGGRVVVDRARRLLFYRGRGSDRWQAFAASVGGQERKTPIGRYAVVRKSKSPWWYPTDRQRWTDPRLAAAVAPGGDNPLGHAALYLSKSGYLVHGTADDRQVGISNTDGCVELRNDVATTLQEDLAAGNQVAVVESDGLIVQSDGLLYLEIGPYWDDNGVKRLSNGVAELKARQFLAFVRFGGRRDVFGFSKISIDRVALRSALQLGVGYPVEIGKVTDRQSISKRLPLRRAL